jgi:transcriptional regulator with XRE-family HTH domain
VDEFYQKLIDGHKHPEDVSFRHMTEPLATEAVLEILAEVFGVPVDKFRQRRRNSSLRGVAARFLCRYAGLTQREVAGTLQVGSGAAISQQMKKVAVQLSKDRRLRRLVEEAEKRLDALRNDTRRGRRQNIRD